MFDLNLEKVCYFIVKARQFDGKSERVDGGSGSNAPDDGETDVLEWGHGDPVEQELREFLDDLNVDEQAELVALMWIGRGTYDKDDWDEAVQTARDEATHTTADYMLGTPLVADYVEDGLAEFGESCDEFNMEHL